ncbi:MAG: hypothetical protein H7Y37_06425 [Anaerolineae bacterium]|nr:hypothetical protein [Gloeobacterales cyanobacterium ES-bin-313]
MSTKCITEHNGKLWFSSAAGLESLDLQSFALHNESSAIIPTCFLSPIGSDYPWCGTKRGIYTFEDNLWKNLRVINATPSGCISCITQDSQGSIWYANEAGLSRLVDTLEAVLQYSKTYKLSKKKVVNLLQDTDATIWCATEDGLFEYQTGKSEFDRIKEVSIINFTEGYSKKLYLTTVTGFSKFEGRTRNVIDNWWLGLPDGATPQCIMDDASGRLLFGTTSGLCVHDQEESGLVQFPKDQVSVQCLFADSQGRVWSGTNHGLFLVDGYTAISVHELAHSRTSSSTSRPPSYEIPTKPTSSFTVNSSKLEIEVRSLREENRKLRLEHLDYQKALKENESFRRKEKDWSKIHKSNQDEIARLEAIVNSTDSIQIQGLIAEIGQLKSQNQLLELQTINSTQQPQEEMNSWRSAYYELLEKYKDLQTQLKQQAFEPSLPQETRIILEQPISTVDASSGENVSLEADRTVEEYLIPQPLVVPQEVPKTVATSPLMKNLLSTYNAVLSKYSENADRKAEIERRFVDGVKQVSVSNIQDVDGGEPPELRESDRATFYLIQDENDYLALPIPAMASMRSSYIREMYNITGYGASIICVDEVAVFQKQGNGWRLVQKGAIVVGSA